MKHKNLSNQIIKTTSITLVFTLVFGVFTQIHAAPPQPENVTVSGDETKPTVTWDAVEAEANGVDWTEETGSAGWTKRVNHTSETFNNKLWVIGGNDGTNRFNDVWHSEDGVNWMKASDNAWSGRSHHTSVVFNDKLWVMGGRDGTNTRLNDVSYTEDGANWTEATGSAAWSERVGLASAVFNGKLWVIGGADATGTRVNDVWHSEDGINWTEATSNAPWSARNGLTAAAFDNKLWVLGGGDGSGDCNGSGSSRCADVWYSEDGTNWTEATNSAWPGRSHHDSIVFDNKIWVAGGLGNSTNFNDVWYSEDGVNWTEATGNAAWSQRAAPALALLGNKLWAMGGRDNNSNYLNDVWSTPNNSISHYRVCWGKTEGECSNSAKVDPDGNVVSLNSSSSSWLTKLKETILPTANAQSGELSYTLEDELDPGTWYFSVTAVTMAGDESTSPGTATHTVEDDSTAGLPDTGYGPQDSSYFVYVLAAAGGVAVLAGGYYWKRKLG